jgi:hypothetical protein
MPAGSSGDLSPAWRGTSRVSRPGPALVGQGKERLRMASAIGPRSFSAARSPWRRGNRWPFRLAAGAASRGRAPAVARQTWPAWRTLSLRRRLRLSGLPRPSSRRLLSTSVYPGHAPSPRHPPSTICGNLARPELLGGARLLYRVPPSCGGDLPGWDGRRSGGSVSSFISGSWRRSWPRPVLGAVRSDRWSTGWTEKSK